MNDSVFLVQLKKKSRCPIIEKRLVTTAGWYHPPTIIGSSGERCGDGVIEIRKGMSESEKIGTLSMRWDMKDVIGADVNVMKIEIGFSQKSMQNSMLYIFYCATKTGMGLKHVSKDYMTTGTTKSIQRQEILLKVEEPINAARNLLEENNFSNISS